MSTEPRLDVAVDPVVFDLARLGLSCEKKLGEGMRTAADDDDDDGDGFSMDGGGADASGSG